MISWEIKFQFRCFATGQWYFTGNEHYLEILQPAENIANNGRIYISIIKYYGLHVVVVCPDLSSKELHIQVDIGMAVTSGSLGDVMVSALVQSARDVGSIPAIGEIFPIFITPHNAVD